MQHYARMQRKKNHTLKRRIEMKTKDNLELTGLLAKWLSSLDGDPYGKDCKFSGNSHST